MSRERELTTPKVRLSIMPHPSFRTKVDVCCTCLKDWFGSHCWPPEPTLRKRLPSVAFSALQTLMGSSCCRMYEGPLSESCIAASIVKTDVCFGPEADLGIIAFSGGLVRKAVFAKYRSESLLSVSLCLPWKLWPCRPLYAPIHVALVTAARPFLNHSPDTRTPCKRGRGVGLLQWRRCPNHIPPLNTIRIACTLPR
jgi:hypothetical protein